jgi:hypothetical protein
MTDDETVDKVPFKPCPACPDGNVWTANGPTGATCPVCRGYAVLHLNGSPIRGDEIEASDD